MFKILYRIKLNFHLISAKLYLKIKNFSMIKNVLVKKTDIQIEIIVCYTVK